MQPVGASGQTMAADNHMRCTSSRIGPFCAMIQNPERIGLRRQRHDLRDKSRNDREYDLMISRVTSALFSAITSNKYVVLYFGGMPMVLIPIACNGVILLLAAVGPTLGLPDISSFREMLTQRCWQPVFGTPNWFYLLFLCVIPLLASAVAQVWWARYLRAIDVNARILWIDAKYWGLMPLSTGSYLVWVLAGGQNHFC